MTTQFICQIFTAYQCQYQWGFTSINFFSPLNNHDIFFQTIAYAVASQYFHPEYRAFLLNFLFFMVDNVLIGLLLHHFFFQSNISTMCSVY